jgi:clan AA aspartic protease
MQGEITPDRQAVVGVVLKTIAGDDVFIDAVVDTGFTEALLVPMEIIEECGYEYAEDIDFLMGNGVSELLPAFRGVVVWHGVDIDLFVVASQAGPLLGMRLLEGSRLAMDVLDGGSVTIQPLKEI